MKKIVLSDVYDLLLDVRMVNSESEFSEYWLGKSESYLRSIRFKNSTPSVGSIAICASKLQYYGNLLSSLDGREAIGERFIKLSRECHRYVNERVGKRAKNF